MFMFTFSKRKRLSDVYVTVVKFSSILRRKFVESSQQNSLIVDRKRVNSGSTIRAALTAQLCFESVKLSQLN